ncbi:dCTP deaminase domain-containing protein [Pseudomonas lijiangensis]|uniref:dUTP pyrophosphatase n=1 Tax=Pseudomonas lijiangensis TaxID=2995658 RepID=A0ABX8HX37_9PSED|nr:MULTISPECIES: dUTP pyrophosphatase [Pseudomonas syringae group]MBX8502990.1 dUTP pyrophosphatase [Pseudomonas lijiangensis]MBX8505147.1 dUTP pyrophosphatase [Pseudomonas lijiangensis]MBX8555747.1 dUTP pyrophosphatase [Pseudomonas cichorii]QWU84513.1 dUTP pyrophosphatase [Pseudomonas lijiangensis]
MSVLQIKGRTTSSYSEFTAASQSSNSLIYTNALERHIEPFSLELSVGDGWSENYSENDRSLWGIEDSITLKGHDSIVVEAGQEVNVPHNRYGIVLPTGSLFLSRGVLVASAKVEPAFSGKLKLRIYNTTNRTIKLEKGEKLGSVIFFSTESTQTHTPITRNSEISTKRITIIARLRKWVGLNKVASITLLVNILCSSLVSSLVIYFLFSTPMRDVQDLKPAASVQPAPPLTRESNKK